jgi:uncharacterized protein (UPF0305 family)
MSDLVSEDDLARARRDPAFRQQMLASNLEVLIAALNKMRREKSDSPDAAAQIREGVDLAVELADRLQRHGGKPGPQAA